MIIIIIIIIDKLKDEILCLWKLKKVTVVFIVGALGSVATNFENWMEKIGIRIEINSVKKTIILGKQEFWEKCFSAKWERTHWTLGYWL